MSSKVETITPSNTPVPIGPYSHVAKAGGMICIGGTGGIDPNIGEVAGPDVIAQTAQILRSFETMLVAAGSDLDHVLHITVFLKDMDDFEDMNKAYVSVMEDRRPARTVIEAAQLPKPDFRVLMNLTAVTA